MFNLFRKKQKTPTYWIPPSHLELPVIETPRKLNSKHLGQDRPLNKYSYDTYINPYYFPCKVCGGYEFYRYLYDGSCYFCILQSPHFQLTIECGRSRSKNYKAVMQTFENINAILKRDDPIGLLSVNIPAFCYTLSEIKRIAFTAGNWKEFHCYLCGNEISGDMLFDLANHLERILKLESCTSYCVLDDGKIIYS